MRRVGDTILNKDSSRSHSVFTIRLVMAPYPTSSDLPYPEQDPTKIVVSQLSLVDLAGSERWAILMEYILYLKNIDFVHIRELSEAITI